MVSKNCRDLRAAPEPVKIAGMKLSAKSFKWLGCVVFVFGLAACQKNAPAPKSPAATGVTTNYYVKGVVKELKPDGLTALIAHEEIPNYMPAMTMPLRAKELKEFSGIKTNDVVHFRMVIKPDDAWIDQVTRIGSATQTNSPFGRDFRPVRDVETLKVGDAIPDYKFTNELGQPVSLAKLKGTTYAFTFIFTRCPYPLFCPLMTRNFSAAAKQLTAASDAPRDWRLFSITFDVEFDTPAALRSYAQAYGYEPQHWSFLTGALIDIDALTEQFGLVFSRNVGSGGLGAFDHNMRTVVIDAAGKVQRIFIGNEWKPDELVEEMKKGAAKK